jgi:hypothetical protein
VAKKLSKNRSASLPAGGFAAGEHKPVKKESGPGKQPAGVQLSG